MLTVNQTVCCFNRALLINLLPPCKSSEKMSSWTFIAAAVVSVFLLDAVVFAQAKVKSAAAHMMDTNCVRSDVHKLVGSVSADV